MVDNLLRIEAKVAGLPNGSHTRIVAEKGNAILHNIALVKERWPQFHWNISSKDNAAKAKPTVIDHKSIYVPIQLNRQNLREVMRERLGLFNIEPETIRQCDAILTEAMP